MGPHTFDQKLEAVEAYERRGGLTSIERQSDLNGLVPHNWLPDYKV